VFRRRRAVDDDELDGSVDDGGVDDGSVGGDPSDAGARGADGGDVGAGAAAATPLPPATPAPSPPGPPARPQGPWDAEDAPDDELLDLGGLRVPLVDGFDISITAEEDIPVVVTYGGPDGLMQLHAFAAPRSSGIWGEVRQEITDSLRQGGGRAQETDGPFGTELSATIPVQTPEGQTVPQPARFIGVDGPRWFLRALITGPIVQDSARAKALEDVIRRVVVVRGTDAMAPREVIPLRLPREVLQAAEEAQQEYDGGAGPAEEPAEGPDTPQRRTLPMPERGPEITEVR
jgi:hypothetical protein